MKIRASLIILLSLFLVACDQSLQADEISQAELKSRISDNAAPTIIDVRSEKEFQKGHVPGAINIPYNDFNTAFSSHDFSKNKELVLYCESGKRAGLAIDNLEKQGFFEVRHLKGDMKAWRKNNN